MDDCFFCMEFSNKPKNIIWIGERFFARLDNVPVAPGHVEIVPIRHISRLEELSVEEFTDLKEAIDNTLGIVKQIDLRKYYETQLTSSDERYVWFAKKMLSHIGLGKPFTDFNAGWNNGVYAGQSVPHVHFHLIPRYAGDVENPRGGIRTIIPGLGNY